MKVKVGDRVQIREWSDMKKEFGLDADGHIKCRGVFVKDMKHLCGRAATVTDVLSNGIVRLNFDDKSGKIYWGYSTDMLCIANDAKKIVITTDGKTTTAKLYDGDTFVKEAVAKCSPSDTFEFNVGATLALSRLTEKPKTLRDVVAERDPDCVKKKFVGGVSQCPQDYLYLGVGRIDGCSYPSKCAECWNSPYKPESKQKTMHIVRGRTDYGEVGKPTELKDINGEALFVGDVVEKFNRELTSFGTTFICSSKRNGDFVMGIAGDSCTKCNHGEIKCGWKIIKRKSHEEARVGDSVDDLKIVTESEVKNA